MPVPILKQGDTLIASVVAALTDEDLVQLRDELATRIGKVRARRSGSEPAPANRVISCPRRRSSRTRVWVCDSSPPAKGWTIG